MNTLPVDAAANVKRKKPKKNPTTTTVQPAAPVPLQSEPEEEEEDEEIVLKYGAKHVIKLFIPVTICLVFVIISLSLIKSYQQSGGAHL